MAWRLTYRRQTNIYTNTGRASITPHWIIQCILYKKCHTSFRTKWSPPPWSGNRWVNGVVSGYLQSCTVPIRDYRIITSCKHPDAQYMWQPIVLRWHFTVLRCHFRATTRVLTDLISSAFPMFDQGIGCLTKKFSKLRLASLFEPLCCDALFCIGNRVCVEMVVKGRIWG